MTDHLVKLALSEEKRDAVLSKVDNTRPYAEKGLAGAGGGLWAGQMIEKLRHPLAPGAAPRRALPLSLAVVGVGMGLGQEKLRRMARQAHYRSILKETRQTSK